MTDAVGTVELALDEYDSVGEAHFRKQFGSGKTVRVLVARGRRYDADAIETAVAVRAGAGPQSSVDTSRDFAIGTLDAAGLRTVEVNAWSPADELAWRFDAWHEIKSRGGLVSPGWLRARGLNGGMQGIWSDKARTSVLSPTGAAVAILHTGRHYADDFHENKIVYRYPRTRRLGSRDSSEIDSVKALQALHLPIFVISAASGSQMRSVHLAWVVASDDAGSSFLIEFGEEEPPAVALETPDGTPFVLRLPRSKKSVTHARTIRDPEFTFRVLHRFRGACAITGISVPAVLDAAHVVPVGSGGSDDERNGLLLTATLHRAYDAHLWAIEPSSLEIIEAPTFRLADIQVNTNRMRRDVRPPHLEALHWRFEEFRRLARLKEANRS